MQSTLIAVISALVLQYSQSASSEAKIYIYSSKSLARVGNRESNDNISFKGLASAHPNYLLHKRIHEGLQRHIVCKNCLGRLRCATICACGMCSRRIKL